MSCLDTMSCHYDGTDLLPEHAIRTLRYVRRVLVGGLAALLAIIVCFCFSKDLVVFLEAPVASKGVRFLQLSPGEFFFTTFKVCPHGRVPLPLVAVYRSCRTCWAHQTSATHNRRKHMLTHMPAGGRLRRPAAVDAHDPV